MTDWTRPGWAAQIRAHLDRDDQYVVVRYWVKQGGKETVTDGVAVYRRPELVAVQVPAGLAPYPDLDMHRTTSLAV